MLAYYAPPHSNYIQKPCTIRVTSTVKNGLMQTANTIKVPLKVQCVQLLHLWYWWMIKKQNPDLLVHSKYFIPKTCSFQTTLSCSYWNSKFWKNFFDPSKLTSVLFLKFLIIYNVKFRITWTASRRGLKMNLPKQKEKRWKRDIP